jgi:hypothetical protein
MSQATQQTIDVGAVANDGTGESLRDAFNAVNNNFANIWAAGPVGTNVLTRNNEVTTNVTNLDLKLAGNGIGNIVVASTLQPTIDGVYDFGRPNQRWSEIHGQYFYGNGAFLTGIDPGNSFTVINANGTPISADSTSDTLTLTTGNNLIMSGNAITDSIEFAVSDSPVFDTVTAVTLSSDSTISNEVTANSLSVAQLANIGNVTISNTTITTSLANADLILSPNGTGVIQSTANIVAPYFIGNVSGNITGNLAAPGANTEVIFNDQGTVNAVPNFSFDKSSSTLSITGNINGTNINGNGYGILHVLADRGGDSTNWDVLLQMGTYTVNRINWGGVTGAPLDSNVSVGLLEVKTANTQGSVLAVEQSYYPGTVESNNVKIQYNRSYWEGIWTQWVRMTNNGQQIDGGSF